MTRFIYTTYKGKDNKHNSHKISGQRVQTRIHTHRHSNTHRVMQYQPAVRPVPLYAPTPVQPAHPTPFYIEDILGRSDGTPSACSPLAPAPAPVPAPPPALPSPNSSFTSWVPPYRSTVYEPTPIHPHQSPHPHSHPHHHHAALAAAAAAAYGNPLYPLHRALLGEYSHALIRHDPLGKTATTTHFYSLCLITDFM